MACTSFLKYAIFATLMLFMSTASGEHIDVCTRTLYRRASTLTSISESYSVAYSYYIACGWWGLQRCRRTGYSPAYRTAYKTVYYSEDYDQCCLEYIGTAPHCQRVCRSLPSYVSHGTVIVNSTFVGGTAVYSCSPGYRVDGAAVLTCQSDSSWNNRVPTCRRVCSVLDGIADGAVSKTDGDFVGSEASYSCSYGYGLVGGSTLTCLNRGEWNGSPPICHKLITCLRPDDPTNGYVTWKSVHNVALVGSLVSYRCSPGYALVGSDSRTCQPNGSWTHSDPQCKRICPTLSAPSNGAMNVSDYFVAGTANFACNRGFEIVGSGQIICEADGLWNQQPSVCNPVCSVPTKPDNGIIVSDGPYFIESNATFACEDGFGVNGNGNITCLSDMTWSGISPICDRVCGPLKQVLNSTLTVNSYFYNAEATYQCNEGFIFKFPGYKIKIITFCCVHAENSNHLLEWVGDHDDVSDCEPIECSTRGLRLINGNFTVTSHYYGGIVTYMCFDGYVLTGPQNRKCSKDSKWKPRINSFCTAEQL